MLALPLLIALTALKEDPTLLPTDALAPAIEAAKTLKCGMTRDQVKAAFVNVKPPDDKYTDEKTGLEAVTWNDVTTFLEENKECGVIVWINPKDGKRLSSVLVACTSLRDQRDPWGEGEATQNRIHALTCDTKKPAPK
jgi:hypothetical protein